jgi:hypothetical protein
MRGRDMLPASGMRSSKSLVVRGGLARTFGGLAGFLVLTFLCSGLYILEDVFANPLEAGAAAVITGAVILALAAVLLFFLIKPRKGPRTTRLDRSVDSATTALKPICEPIAGAVRQDPLQSNLSYQRRYIDHSRIRP